MTEDRSAAGWLAKLHFAEDALNVVILVVMAVLPLIEIVARIFGVSVPGSIQYVSMLTMWIGFTGAMLATRDDKHLALSTGSALLKGRAEQVARAVSVTIAAIVTGALAWGAWGSVEAEMASTQVIPPGIPVWVGQVVMPVGYAVIALRLILAKYKSWIARGVLVAVVGGVLWYAKGAGYETAEGVLWPGVVIVLIATGLGAPIYVALGAAAVLFFWADDVPVAAVAAETVRQIKSPIMPSIPLFTFTGYILAEANASTRLVRAFRALFGWMPGGTAVMTAVVCAFFTTFTGASGVTILALGGLLYPVLRQEMYPKGFSVGMLTASGSIGLLFPPSLPVILYAVTAHVPVDKMFVAGILPGFVLVGALSLLGVRTGMKSEVKRVPFDAKEAFAAVRGAAWELVLPLIVIGGIFLGLTTIVEAAALTAAYALFVEVVIYKDLSIKEDLVRVGRDCASLVGGVLIILGVAMGFTSYLVDGGVPELALEWVQGGIESKIVFLIVLNLFLLVVGCLMDIFSAIVVVVPLILPIGRHFGIDPIHLGIIFLANLELGFLTPPVGMNLFLSSYRFEEPLTKVYRYAIPFLLILILAVLLITYVPDLTLAPVEWVFGPQEKAIDIQF
ncbi:MAG: TRAP transporter large permease subunit [Deltaproteobacteria bacterium]